MRELRQVAAGRGRGDTGFQRELGGRHRAAIHEGIQHAGAGWVGYQCRDRCNGRCVDHTLIITEAWARPKL